jgi:hypothetical protein
MYSFRLAWTLVLDTLNSSASKSFPLMEVAPYLRYAWKSQTTQSLSLFCRMSNAIRSPTRMLQSQAQYHKTHD